jgi:hypothetical protein
VIEVEQGWTGVEDRDRAFIAKLVQANLWFLILVCLLRYTVTESQMTLQEYFWALPKPVLSDDDIAKALNASYGSLSMTWKTWSKDPIKAAALQAIFSCQRRLGGQLFFGDIASALAQTGFVRFLHSYLLQVEEVAY